MEFDFKIPSEDLLDDIGFLGAQHAVVDEDAGELLADGLVNQSRSNAGVNASTQAKDHLVLADLLADFFHGLINVVAHCPFAATATNLVNEIGNDGLFTENRLTDDGNKPSDDLFCVKLSPGRAYVRGFDVNLSGTTVLDVDKPRDVQTVNAASIPFEMGSLLRVNNAQGTPMIRIGGGNANVIKLLKSRKLGTGGTVNVDQAFQQIGEARVYHYALTDDSYKNSNTEFDLYLYDIQTFTVLKCSSFTASTVIQGARIRGKASGAIGYAALDADSTGANEIAVSETTGTFIKGEQLIINERSVVADVSIKDIVAYTVDDIKSVFQDSDGLNSGLLSNFSADTVLYEKTISGFSLTDQLNVTGNTATVNNRNFAAKVGIHTDAIIAYQRGDFEDIVYNKITNISTDGKTLTLGAVGVHTGVNRGEVLASGISTSSPFRLVTPIVQNLDGSGIFATLPKQNISNVNLADSNLIINKQIKGGPANISNNTIQFASSVGLTTSVGITSVFFEPFDAERYSIHYSDGSTEPLTDDQVEITNNGNLITFSGLKENSGSAVVNVTLKKLGLTSKTKDFVRSQKVEVTRTVGVSTLSSLLEPSAAYGLRVEDSEISLNVPDVVEVVAVLESKDTNAPVLDKLKFVSGLNFNTNAIVGELIVGKDSRAIGQLVDRNANDVTFIYLNDSKFQIGEVVNFKESAIESVIQGVEVGNYIDRTDNYTLDKGHKEQYLSLIHI